MNKEELQKIRVTLVAKMAPMVLSKNDVKNPEMQFKVLVGLLDSINASYKLKIYKKALQMANKIGDPDNRLKAYALLSEKINRDLSE